ncbi:MAG: phosphatidate cytidylyltransferase [Desulfovibrionaceae bacterium]
MLFNTHLQRITTGLLALTVPALALFLGGPVLFAVLVLLAALTLWEFYGLFWGTEHKRLRWAGMICASLLLWAAATANPTWLALAILLGFWTGGLAFLFRFKTDQELPLKDAAIFFFGLTYLPLTLHFLLFMRPMEIILVLFATMASDTAAFYFGTFWGKTKIWPTVSPKKSWVGSWSGMVAGTITTIALGLSFGQAPWWGYLALGLLLNVAAQLGDFFESALKRGLGVKDSGNILPGHGGLLDRIDSLLFAIPAYALAHELFPSLELVGGFTSLLLPVVGP